MAGWGVGWEGFHYTGPACEQSPSVSEGPRTEVKAERRVAGARVKAYNLSGRAGGSERAMGELGRGSMGPMAVPGLGDQGVMQSLGYEAMRPTYALQAQPTAPV